MATLSILVSIALVSCIVSGACLVVVKRLFSRNQLESHHTVANALLAVLGTLYSILLGFLISAGYSYHYTVRQNLELEANSLGNLFRVARGLPEVQRVALRGGCRTYCDAVVKLEWPAMESGKTAPEAWSAYSRLWDYVLSVTPTDDRTSNLHASLMSAATELGEARRIRVSQLRFKTWPLLWAVLLLGACLVVIFSYLFATEGQALHGLMSTFVTLSLSLIIALFYFYTHPFSGPLQVAPEAFEIESSLFQEGDHQGPPYLEEWSRPAPTPSDATPAQDTPSPTP